MPAVPEAATLPSEQQQVGGLPSIHSESPLTMFGGLGAGAEALGKGTEQLSDAYANHAMQVAALNNKAMSDKAYTGYLNDAGQLEADFQEKNRNVDPTAGQQVYQDYVSKLEQLRQQYRGTLTNPMAQSTFDQDSRRMQGYMIMNGSKTVAAGVHAYRESAFNGAQATLAAHVAAATDPEQQELLKQQIVNGTYAWGKSQNLPEDAIKAEILKRTSSVDVSIIDQKIKSDAEGAMVYFREHQAEMTPEHQGALEEQLTGALTLHGAVQAAAAGMTVAGQTAGQATVARQGSSAAHGLVPAMGSIEQGIVQAFPGTRVTSEVRTPGQSVAAHGFANDPHTQGRAVDFHIPEGMTGQEFAAQIKEKFPQATVLYEGPGAVHSTAPHVHVQVSGTGSQYMPGTPGAQLDAIQGNAQNIFAATDTAAAAYAEKWGLDPVAVKYQAEQKVQSDMNRQEYQFRQQEESSRQNLLTAISTPGTTGDMPSDLPTLFHQDPSLQADFNNLTGSDRRAVQGALRSNANVLTPNRQVQWENLSGMDSQTFLAQNPLDPKLDLTTSQRMEMINQQKTLRKQAARAQDHDARISTITNNRIVHSALMENGILDSSGQPADPQGYNVFVGRMLEAEQQWTAAHPTHKGAIPDQEIINMATPILARRGATKPMQLFGMDVPFTGDKGQAPPVIPPDRYNALHDMYVQTHGGQEPNPEQIGQAYELRRQHGLEK